jgi:hypothetical protein
VLKLAKDNIENYASRKKQGSKRSSVSTHGHSEIKPYQKVMSGMDMNYGRMDNSENMPENREYMQTQVDTELLIEKEQTIQELRETIGILEIKLKKFEQLVKLKDQKVLSQCPKVSDLYRSKL